MPLSFQDALIEAMKAGWGTIDDVVDRLDVVADFDWSAALLDDDHALRQLKKILARRGIRELKDETGFPVIASIKRANADTGQEERIYKQESLFDLEDYQQVVNYWVERTNYGATMARSYQARARGRLGTEIPLQFDLWGGSDGGA